MGAKREVADSGLTYDVRQSGMTMGRVRTSQMLRAMEEEVKRREREMRLQYTICEYLAKKRTLLEMYRWIS